MSSFLSARRRGATRAACSRARRTPRARTGTVVNGDFEGESSAEAANARDARSLAEGWLRGMVLELLEKARAICGEAETRFDDALMWKGKPCEPWLREVRRQALASAEAQAKKPE